ncbi:cell cycle exit and neuronal differentiation protein 1 [Hemicordylus capensis]|uniref:cell cycle exit and neuronal differentiation protein 1 n=1 Tax=Hemicordylus capensis TaxID=884348 RepID=UPI00230457E9|nr:cell cycle exit and neuronal differentiation protein 1 [Hemicordylus capensis]
MESKGSARSGNKPDAKTTSSGKPEKPNPGPVAPSDKKEPLSKEHPGPAATTPAKKVAASANEAALLNNHSNMKPSPAAAATEGPEATGLSGDSEHKGSDGEESPGSSLFENMKPLIIVGGAAAVAVIAVIVGVAILARKK